MERVEVVREQINLESGQEETVSDIQERVFVDLTGSVGENFAELPSDRDANDNLVNYSEKEWERVKENPNINSAKK